jgi:hypothetical protein
MEDTPEAESVAERVRVTDVLAVKEAPPSMTTDPVGAARSRTIVSLTEEEEFPAASRNWAWTVFVPSGPASVKLFEVAYVSHEDQFVPSVENRACETPEPASVALRLSVTEVVVVHAAPLFTEMVPVGPARSRTIVSLTEVEEFPAASRN